MEVKIISKEAIKPSKRTPSHSKFYKFSSLDQLSPSIYVPILLFYQPPLATNTPANLSLQLKNSLSEILTYYYPFAGKIKDGVSIECDDEGVLFLEAQAKNNLADILAFPDIEASNKLYPDDLQWKSSRNSSVMAVQLSYFDCGGFSIGVCISHKIADACTIVTFLKDWASQARLCAVPIRPILTSTSIFPPSEQFVKPELELVNANVVTRRYVFSPTKLSELKATIASNSRALQNPTRVEAVTSLIYKCIIQANTLQSLGLNVKSYVMAQTVNLRARMVPSLPKNSIGNIVWYFPVMIEAKDDISLERLATQMREGLKKLCNFARNVEGKDWLLKVTESQKNARTEHSMNDAYKFSSWCKYRVYEVDFGWGSPIWVSGAEYPYKNSIILMDTKDGEGIEAWVTLDEEVMYILQEGDEFSKFASLNPSIFS